MWIFGPLQKEWQVLCTNLYLGHPYRAIVDPLIEHQNYLNWRHSDRTTIHSVNDKKQNSVQSCCISLCTQQSQSAGKFFGHWDAQFYTVMFTSTVNYRITGIVCTRTHIPELGL